MSDGRNKLLEAIRNRAGKTKNKVTNEAETKETLPISRPTTESATNDVKEETAEDILANTLARKRAVIADEEDSDFSDNVDAVISKQTAIETVNKNRAAETKRKAEAAAEAKLEKEQLDEQEAQIVAKKANAEVIRLKREAKQMAAPTTPIPMVFSSAPRAPTPQLTTNSTSLANKPPIAPPMAPPRAAAPPIAPSIAVPSIAPPIAPPMAPPLRSMPTAPPTPATSSRVASLSINADDIDVDIIEESKTTSSKKASLSKGSMFHKSVPSSISPLTTTAANVPSNIDDDIQMAPQRDFIEFKNPDSAEQLTQIQDAELLKIIKTLTVTPENIEKFELTKHDQDNLTLMRKLLLTSVVHTGSGQVDGVQIHNIVMSFYLYEYIYKRRKELVSSKFKITTVYSPLMNFLHHAFEILNTPSAPNVKPLEPQVALFTHSLSSKEAKKSADSPVLFSIQSPEQTEHIVKKLFARFKVDGLGATHLTEKEKTQIKVNILKLISKMPAPAIDLWNAQVLAENTSKLNKVPQIQRRNFNESAINLYLKDNADTFNSWVKGIRIASYLPVLINLIQNRVDLIKDSLDKVSKSTKTKILGDKINVLRLSRLLAKLKNHDSASLDNYAQTKTDVHTDILKTYVHLALQDNAELMNEILMTYCEASPHSGLFANLPSIKSKVNPYDVIIASSTPQECRLLASLLFESALTDGLMEGNENIFVNAMLIARSLGIQAWREWNKCIDHLNLRHNVGDIILYENLIINDLTPVTRAEASKVHQVMTTKYKDKFAQYFVNPDNIRNAMQSRNQPVDDEKHTARKISDVSPPNSSRPTPRGRL
jgi:hypothetical protein